MNDFFRKLYSNPILLWNASAAVIFITIGLAVIAVPSITGGDNRFRFGFGGILTVYGLFRAWTFYVVIKRRDDA